MGVKHRCEIKRHPATDTPRCPLCEARPRVGPGVVLLLLAALVAFAAWVLRWGV